MYVLMEYQLIYFRPTGFDVRRDHQIVRELWPVESRNVLLQLKQLLHLGEPAKKKDPRGVF